MENNGKQWSGRSRGGGFGYNFFIFLMRVSGIRGAYAFLSLVVVYFIPFAPRATRAVWFYNRRILGYGRLRAAVKLYAHYYALGQTIIDRVAIGSGMERKYKFEFENYDAFLRVLDGGRGAVIIGAHVGCWGHGGRVLRGLRPQDAPGDVRRRVAADQKRHGQALQTGGLQGDRGERGRHRVDPPHQGGARPPRSTSASRATASSKAADGEGALHGARSAVPGGAVRRRPGNSASRWYSTMPCASAAGATGSSSTSRTGSP